MLIWMGGRHVYIPLEKGVPALHAMTAQSKHVHYDWIVMIALVGNIITVYSILEMEDGA